MHKYLRSIGFSGYRKEKDIDALLSGFEERYVSIGKNMLNAVGDIQTEIRAQVAKNIGVCIVGTFDEDGAYRRQCYYPYLSAEDVSTTVPVSVHHRVDEEIYSGLADDSRIGVTLIFRLDNVAEYFEQKKAGADTNSCITKLSAFCDEGKVLLPVSRTVKQAVGIRKDYQQRDELIEAAKGGDENALESLTMGDMKAYMEVSRRLSNEDIYSIVDSCFMPQGVECDVYQVVGEIVKVEKMRNLMTDEEIFDLTIECNDMIMHIGINRVDLAGEPEPGRRFKGRIWMQGRIELAGMPGAV